MPKQNAIGTIIEEGSNSNGQWVRIGGTLRCRHLVTLTFANSTTVNATWTFPSAFKAGTKPLITVTLQDVMPNSTPTIRQVSTLLCNNDAVTNTTAPIAMARIVEQTNFVSGDTVLVAVIAEGEAP